MPKKLPAADQTRVPWEAAFAHALAQRREARGMSQSELARRATDAGLTLHQTTIARIENGTRSVNFNEALTLANLLGANPLEMAEYVAETEDPARLADLAVERAQEVARTTFAAVYAAWDRLDQASNDASQWTDRAWNHLTSRWPSDAPALTKASAWKFEVFDLKVDSELAKDLHQIEHNQRTIATVRAMATALERFLDDASDDNMRPIVEPRKAEG